MFETIKNFGLLILMTSLIQACGSKQIFEKPDFDPALPVVTDSPPNKDGSIYNANTNRFLFEDIRARRVGDLITVILDERTNAVKSASTSTSKDTSLEMPGPTLLGLPITLHGREILNNSLESASGFKGAGDSSQSNSLSGNITVTIAQVLPNDNLVIRGQKLLTLNQGSEVVRISGIIRSTDISPQNTIISTKIANANITYGGSGMVADSNKAGWVTRIVNSQLWPF